MLNGILSTMGAIVQVSRENLALALLWSAIGACTLFTLFAPNMSTAAIGGSGLMALLGTAF